MSKDQLAEQLYGWGEEVGANAIEVYVHRLRKKLESAGVSVRTIRGLGYLLEKRRRMTKSAHAAQPAVAVGQRTVTGAVDHEHDDRPRHVASGFVNLNYDRALLDTALDLGRNVREANNQLYLDLPQSVIEMLISGEQGRFYYRANGPVGEYITGDPDLPNPRRKKPRRTALLTTTRCIATNRFAQSRIARSRAPRLRQRFAIIDAGRGKNEVCADDFSPADHAADDGAPGGAGRSSRRWRYGWGLVWACVH